MKKMLMEILDDGMRLEMGDGSVWEIDPSDASICCTWTPTNEVLITHGSEGMFPYTLRDTGSGSSVRARPSTE